MTFVGSVINDRYEIIAELGKGGMSTVYLARDRSLGSYWAIKHVINNKTIDVEAFKKEVELLASLNNADIPRIVDRIEIDENYFVCMDFIDGVSLGKKVSVEGPQKEADVIKWAIMLCDILDYLHNVRSNPIVYSDLKPGNIMLTTTGRVMLIDFGIARECVRGQVESRARVGTKGYAAPEQYKGHALDERTDIYSLGVTLFNLVTGVEPGNPPNAVKPIREIDTSLSEGLEYIINKCTQVDINKRYKNCKELKYDFENIEKINSKFKKIVTKRLFRFCASLICLIISIAMVVIGFEGLKKETQNNYEYAYTEAIKCEKNNDADEAEDYYKKAIEYKPSDVDTYIRLFNLLLPKEQEDYSTKTKNAIDTLKGYVENQASPIYNNSQILYILSKKCIDVNETTYADYAFKFLGKIKESNEYKNNELNKNEIDNLYIIASNLSKDTSSFDFEELNSAIEELKSNTQNDQTMSEDEKLSIYYTIMVIYNSYPNKLDDSYNKIVSLGNESKLILDNDSNGEEINFADIIPMYRLVASSLYNEGISFSDIDAKRNTLKESIKWFGYLDDFSDKLPEALEIKKGSAYKDIVETYTSVDQRGNVNSEILDDGKKGAEIYQDILKNNSDSFLASINLTQLLIDTELLKQDAASRNYSNAISEYQRLVNIKNSHTDLSKSQLSQFSSIKEQLSMLGVDAK